MHCYPLDIADDDKQALNFVKIQSHVRWYIRFFKFTIFPSEIHFQITLSVAELNWSQGSVQTSESESDRCGQDVL